MADCSNDAGVMTKATNALGRRGEKTAQSFLESRGLTLIDSNWRAGSRGEIDLIMEDDREVIFVEVKTRRGNAEAVFEVVGSQKLGRLKRVAAAWLCESAGGRPYRIDLVGVAVRPGTQSAEIHWWKGIDR